MHIKYISLTGGYVVIDMDQTVPIKNTYTEDGELTDDPTEIMIIELNYTDKFQYYNLQLEVPFSEINFQLH